MKIVLLLIFILFASHAWSGDDEPLFNIIQLHATAVRQIDNDQMTVWLSIEHEDKDPVIAAQRVNQDMHWALEQVKKNSAIHHQTYSYSTRPVYGEKESRPSAAKGKRIVAWRTTQQLRLESEYIQKLTKLIGQLQMKLAVKHMQFSPSKKARLAAENALIEAALIAFKNKVNIVMRTMDENNYRVLDLDIGHNHNRPIATYQQGRMHSKALSSNLLPEFSAGKSEIEISVSGRVQLY